MEDLLLSELSAVLYADAKTSESSLESILTTPNLISLLVKISVDNSYSEEVRQVAVNYLEILCKNCTGSSSLYYIPQIDKDFLKLNILRGLNFSIPEKIRSQFEEIAYTLVKTDYTFLEVIGLIRNGLDDPILIYAALRFMYRKYEPGTKFELEGPLYLFFWFIPDILRILKSMVPFTNTEYCTHVEIILRIYLMYLSNYENPEHAEGAVLDEWLNCFKIILDHPMENPQGLPDSEEKEKMQEKLPQWTCKKLAFKIIHQILLINTKGKTLFNGVKFQMTWVLEFLELATKHLYQAKEKFILYNNLKFVCLLVRFVPSIFLGGELIPYLMVDVLLPMLYRVQSDQDLWNSNPIEFINREIEGEVEVEAGINPETEFDMICCSQKTSVLNFLLNSGQISNLVICLEITMKELQESVDLVRKEASLLVLGNFNKLVQGHSIVDCIERLLIDYVLPEFTSQNSLLRYRAVWVCYRFWNICPKFDELVLEPVWKLLTDPELPVRYFASLFMATIMEWDMSKDRIGRELESLLRVYFKLMNEIYSEDLVNALETITTKFPKEIIPFASEMTLQLVRAFNKINGTDIKEISIISVNPQRLWLYCKDHSYLTHNELITDLRIICVNLAELYLSGIQQILDALNESPDDLIKISFTLKSLLDYCLSEEGYIYSNSGALLLTVLLYHTPDDSMPHLCYLTKNLFPSILGKGGKTFFYPDLKDPDQDFYDSDHYNFYMPLSALANFIKKYKEETLENLQSILDIAFRLLKGEEEVKIRGFQILICILENYKFAIDSYLQQILSEISAAFNNGSEEIKNLCSQATCVALWNSTILTLSAEPLVSSVLQFSLINIKNCVTKNNISSICQIDSARRSHMIYGFGSLFLVIPQLSNQILSILPFVFKAIIQLCIFSGESRIWKYKELIDDKELIIDLDTKCQNLIMMIRMIEPEHHGNYFGHYVDTTVLYDSPFENMNRNLLTEGIVRNLRLNYPEIMRLIYNSLHSKSAN